MNNIKKTKFNFTKILTLVLALVFITGSVPACAAKQKSVTVSTRKQLISVMKQKKSATIILDTGKKVSLKILETKGSENKKLIIRSDEATVRNSAAFRSITLEECKNYTENASGNSITVKDDRCI